MTTSKPKPSTDKPWEEKKVEARRRRRKGPLGTKVRRLAVDMSQLDTENYSYRFATDKANRIQGLTKLDDWDIVPNEDNAVKEDSTDLGTQTSLVVGTDDKGQPTTGYLLRKPKKWFEHDKAARQRAIDEQIDEINNGVVRDQDGTVVQETYTPSEANQITKG